jgi:hypothetical protein
MKTISLKLNLSMFLMLILFFLHFLPVYAEVQFCHAQEINPTDSGNTENKKNAEDIKEAENVITEETSENKKSFDDSVKFRISVIKYLNQNEKGKSQWCAVYSTAMLLSYWGIDVEPREIAAGLEMETRDTPYFSFKSIFTLEGSIEAYLRKNHNLETRKKIFVSLRPDTEKWVKNQIKADRPVILMYHRIDGHAVVVVGYDDQYIYFNDPSGALFANASVTLERNAFPSVWLSEDRASMFEGAGLRWEDFREFLRIRNILGLFIVATYINKPPAEIPDGGGNSGLQKNKSWLKEACRE